MPVKQITLKTAKKKPGSLSRAKVRSVVAAIYSTTPVKTGAAKNHPSAKVIVTKTAAKPLPTK